MSLCVVDRKHEYPFSDIKDMSIKGEKFILKFFNKNVPTTVFLGLDTVFTEDVYQMATLHHKYFLRNAAGKLS